MLRECFLPGEKSLLVGRLTVSLCQKKRLCIGAWIVSIMCDAGLAIHRWLGEWLAFAQVLVCVGVGCGCGCGCCCCCCCGCCSCSCSWGGAVRSWPGSGPYLETSKRRWRLMQYAACLAQHPTWVRQEMSYHLETHMTYKTSLVGGLEHLDYFSTYW